MPTSLKQRHMHGMHGGLALGIDPGLAHCGFALVSEGADGKIKVVHTQLVTTTKQVSDDPTARISDDDTRRMILIQRATVALLAEYVPTIVGIETYVPLQGKGGGGAYKVAAIYGLVHGLATSANRPVYGASPQDIRRALLGTATGTKKDIERAIKGICGGVSQALDTHRKNDREHIADAIAHGIYVLDRTRVARRMAQSMRKRFTVAYEIENQPAQSS